MASDDPTIVHDDRTGRFQLEADGDATYLEYRRDGDELTLVHTQVADEHEGQGVGSALVRAALDHAESERLTVVPQCPFVAGWLERHPDRAAELDIA